MGNECVNKDPGYPVHGQQWDHPQLQAEDGSDGSSSSSRWRTRGLQEQPDQQQQQQRRLSHREQQKQQEELVDRIEERTREQEQQGYHRHKD